MKKRAFVSCLIAITGAVISSSASYRLAKERFYGVPIRSACQRLQNITVRPLGIIVGGNHIFIYGGDGKVYNLDGVYLEGVAPNDLIVPHGAFTLLRTNGEMHLRRELF